MCLASVSVSWVLFPFLSLPARICSEGRRPAMWGDWNTKRGYEERERYRMSEPPSIDRGDLEAMVLRAWPGLLVTRNPDKANLIWSEIENPVFEVISLCRVSTGLTYICQTLVQSSSPGCRAKFCRDTFCQNTFPRKTCLTRCSRGSVLWALFGLERFPGPTPELSLSMTSPP